MSPSRLLVIFFLVARVALPSHAERRDWAGVRSFAYQLQKLNLTTLASSAFDLLIIDYSADGTMERRFTRQQIQALQKGPGGRRRLVLAYMSIGEAESYRFYWNWGFRPGRPAWLDRVNPEWEGNYKVHYWDPEWQKLLYGSPQAYLDQILAAGFDGVYLDLIDAYEYYETRGHKNARAAMINLVKRLAIYARAHGGMDFGVFPQNGEELLLDPGYLTTITGIGREDVYYGEEGEGKASSPKFTARAERYLNRAAAAGKLVLTVDYTGKPEQARRAHLQASTRGYREYVGPRKLDELRVYPGLQPKER